MIYLFVSTLFRIFALEKTKDMATEISTYIHEGMELPFEDWSNTVHSFGDLASNNQLFVSTYMLQLPDKKTLEEFLLKQMGK